MRPEHTSTAMMIVAIITTILAVISIMLSFYVDKELEEEKNRQHPLAICPRCKINGYYPVRLDKNNACQRCFPQ